MPAFLPLSVLALPVRRRAMCGLLTVAAMLGAIAPASADDTALSYDVAVLDSDTAALDTQGNGQTAAPPAETLPSATIEATPDPVQDNRRWSRDYLAIAVGVVTAPSYNGSDDRVFLPGFYVRGRFKGYSISTRGTNLQVDLIRQRRGQKTDFKFGPLINLRGDRTGRIKDAQVEALGERKLAAELGVSTGVTHTGVFTSDYDQIGFRLVGLYDVSGRHSSWIVSPTVEYSTPLSKRSYLGVSASANFYGKGFGRYYYDIDAAGSAASGLPVYQAAGNKMTLGKYTFGVAGAYALEKDLRKGFVLIGGAQYGRLSGRLADSPIVRIAGDADQWLAGAGVAYNF